MKIAIVSPHTDDAIFSLANYIETVKEVTIVSPLAGIPTDKMGRAKHELLNTEHEVACTMLGVKSYNGPFLDDVYPGLDEEACKQWLFTSLKQFHTVLVPLGIHHPDHIVINRLCMELKPSLEAEFYLYAELPYRVLYPKLAQDRLESFHVKSTIFIDSNGSKKKYCQAYASQTKWEGIFEQLLVQERIYGI